MLAQSRTITGPEQDRHRLTVSQNPSPLCAADMIKLKSIRACIASSKCDKVVKAVVMQEHIGFTLLLCRLESGLSFNRLLAFVSSIVLLV